MEERCSREQERAQVTLASISDGVVHKQQGKIRFLNAVAWKNDGLVVAKALDADITVFDIKNAHSR